MTELTQSSSLGASAVASLARLSIVTRRRAPTGLPGRRPAAFTGSGVDFADFRPYSPGDDIRNVDWPLYARLGKLFSRQYHAESELAVHILLDVSRSMQFGRFDKLDFAKRLARALAYVGLSDLDRVGLATFSDRLHRQLPPRRAGGQLARVFRMLEESEVQGRTDLNRVLRDYGVQARRPGLVVILSDFFTPRDCTEGLDYLRYKNFEVVLIQVLAREELDPRIEPDAELADAEQRDLPHLTADREAVRRYRGNLEAFEARLARSCLERGLTFVCLESSLGFDGLLRKLLEGGVWERR